VDGVSRSRRDRSRRDGRARPKRVEENIWGFCEG